MTKGTLVMLVVSIWGISSAILFLVFGGGMSTHGATPIKKTYYYEDNIESVDYVKTEKVELEDNLQKYIITICFLGAKVETILQNHDKPVYKLNESYEVEAIVYSNNRQDVEIKRDHIKSGCSIENKEKYAFDRKIRIKSKEPHYVLYHGGNCPGGIGCFKFPQKNNREIPIVIEKYPPQTVTNIKAYFTLPIAWLIDIIFAPIQVLMLMIFSFGMGAGIP